MESARLTLPAPAQVAILAAEKIFYEGFTPNSEDPKLSRMLKAAYAVDFAALQQQLAEAQAEVAKYKSFAEDQDNMLAEIDRLKAELSEVKQVLNSAFERFAWPDKEAYLARWKAGDAK